MLMKTLVRDEIDKTVLLNKIGLLKYFTTFYNIFKLCTPYIRP